ncbi:MAG: helix-turn-helix transcriptional regulator [Elusimicrobia bacterium]|nr:helix-turn-helix transcriptional regulator [Elusimicrobiota bacterium]
MKRKRRKLRKFSDRLKEELAVKEFAVEFKKECDLAKLGMTLAKLRKSRGLTQKKLAKLIHTSQQAISRLENADSAGCTLATLTKIARATDSRLKVSFTK